MYLEAALLLPLAHDRQLGLDVDEVVHEHRVDPVGLEPRQRVLQAGLATHLAADVGLGREEQTVANVQLLREVADDGLGRAVDHGRVHDLAAELDEASHRVAQRRALLLARADAVAIRPDTHGRQQLAARRNAFLDELAALRDCVPGAAQRGRGSERRPGLECLPSRHRHPRTPTVLNGSTAAYEDRSPARQAGSAAFFAKICRVAPCAWRSRHNRLSTCIARETQWIRALAQRLAVAR